MGKLSITVDAETNGKKLNFTSIWKAGEREIQNVIKFIEKMANDRDLEPEAVAQATALRLAATGITKIEGPQRVQMMAILSSMPFYMPRMTMLTPYSRMRGN